MGSSLLNHKLRDRAIYNFGKILKRALTARDRTMKLCFFATIFNEERQMP